MSERDAYEVLQVTATAHQLVVKAAYRTLAALYHPDNDSMPGATRRMAELNDAYAKVRTLDRRQLYDRSVAILTKNQPSPAQGTWTPPSGGSARTRPSNSVVEFGRYDGWTVAALAQHDPDYLRWLARHSSGLRFRREIEELLGPPAKEPVPARGKRR
jgi:curved DNA-binding protein CbpA